jgi:hypothetical protein
VRPEGLGKFKNSPHRVSNQRPSSLKHSALTTTLPRTPESVGKTDQLRKGLEVGGSGLYQCIVLKNARRGRGKPQKLSK